MRVAAARDPRKDPKPGDVVAFTPGSEKELYEVYERINRPDAVLCRSPFGKCSITIRDWQKWSRRKDAEVLHVAE